MTEQFDISDLASLGVKINQLATDSRLLKKGEVFLAFPGVGESSADGRDFIAQAIRAGASAVLWEAGGYAWNPEWRVPNLPVANLRERAGAIASHVYGYPSQNLSLVGITGTNGKTSCSHWIAQAMNALGKKTAVIGTLGNGFLGALETTPHTTPDAVTLQKRLAQFLTQGASVVAMEVSSHGLEQGRVNGAQFSTALLTNVTRDHLDYHGDMAAYTRAKAKLFAAPGLKAAVLNLDDAVGAAWIRQWRELKTYPAHPAEVIAYGFNEAALHTPPARGNGEKLRSVKSVIGHNLKLGSNGTRFDIDSSWGAASLKSAMVGRYNAANLLAVLATLLANGTKLQDAVKAMAHLRPVPGRMQQLGGGSLPLVVVDYAHTPDALEKVLSALREILEYEDGQGDGSERRIPSPRPLPNGARVRAAPLRGGRDETKFKIQNSKLICVFGCGGDRDSGKRPLMGQLAAQLADEIVITSDNPRNELPETIIKHIVAGVVKAGADYQLEEDRYTAIVKAVLAARPGDVVLVAGKGHEAWQEIRGTKIPFNDVAVAREALREWALDWGVEQGVGRGAR